MGVKINLQIYNHEAYYSGQINSLSISIHKNTQLNTSNKKRWIKLNWREIHYVRELGLDDGTGLGSGIRLELG